MPIKLIWFTAFVFILSACEEQQPRAVGQLTSDRIELVAESAEPIISIPVIEGQQLNAGDTVIVQNSDRLEIRLREANANISRIEAMLAEQISGPREEIILASRASLSSAEIEYEFRVRELARLDTLRDRNLTSIESVELAKKMMDSAEAGINLAKAQLDELEAGTRIEQIEQTQHSLEQAQAQLASLEYDLQRQTVTTGVAGIVDSLPFETGERPAIGDVVAVLLGGSQPHARVYVPEQYRVGIAPGDTIQVAVDGLENVLTGTVRRIASDAAFTPYFSLTENDRSRLTFIAEITLPELPSRLPDGVPVEVVFASVGEQSE
jgi:HlyD family secretion protein